MLDVAIENGTTPGITDEMVRAQLELLVRDEAFRSSKRSIAFLRYVVEQTLAGQADQIKERSIGIEVFGRDPAYDTNGDHVVRTAAAELRKRLATYYVDKKHDTELRMSLLPGSYVPRFTLPGAGSESDEHASQNGHGESGRQARPEPLAQEKISPASVVEIAPRLAFLPGRRARIAAVAAILVLAGVAAAAAWMQRENNAGTAAEDEFWTPVVNTQGPVLIAVGSHPNGPPRVPAGDGNGPPPTPIPSSDLSETVPFGDTVTIARLTGTFEARNKQVVIRRESASSFSDLRQGAAVLVGAFNNEWSLRLTRQLRFSFALDADRHLIYIRDAKTPASRSWSWATNQPSRPATGANSPKLEDFALISRVRDSETGHTVVIIGGLYSYGTQAAGEFLTDPALMREFARQARLNPAARNLQIVLGTTVTDGTSGPPQVLAVSEE